MVNPQMRIFRVLILIACCSPTIAASQSPYVGMESREIKSLSEDDINQLRNGAGWGLALPAELNGMPGPAHVLELQSALNLSSAQINQIQALFDDMKKDAVLAGEQLITAERDLEAMFASGSVDELTLKSLLSAAERARTELRFIHLSQHYKTPAILTNEQIRLYSQLRGYSGNDPCINVPAGHNPEMYKKHMGCN